MVDRLNREDRSRVMRGIKSTNTKPELEVRSLLHHLGYRFRLHRRDLPGKPDIVLPKHRAVIFVNGCFWHCHTCKMGHVPRSRTEYWAPKLRRTQERDVRNYAMLGELGWRVKVVWECEVNDQKTLSSELTAFFAQG